jgi:hypothetical protein
MAYQAGRALESARFLVYSALVGRLFTFFLNVIIARSVDVATYGYARRPHLLAGSVLTSAHGRLFSVNLYLLDAMILMLTREALRRATPRVALALTARTMDAGARRRKREIVNALWAVVPAGLVVAGAVTFGFRVVAFRGVADGGSPDPEYLSALSICAVASVVTLLGEPLYLIAEANLVRWPPRLAPATRSMLPSLRDRNRGLRRARADGEGTRHDRELGHHGAVSGHLRRRRAAARWHACIRLGPAGLRSGLHGTVHRALCTHASRPHRQRGPS